MTTEVNLNQKQTEELFARLGEWAKEKNNYSIRDFANEVGVPYKQIFRLAQEDEDFHHIFELARCRLAVNAHDVVNKGEMDFFDSLKHLYENDFELKEVVKMEGGEVPEDPDEYDKWIDGQIARDRKNLGSF